MIAYVREYERFVFVGDSAKSIVLFDDCFNKGMFVFVLEGKIFFCVTISATVSLILFVCDISSSSLSLSEYISLFDLFCTFRDLSLNLYKSKCFGLHIFLGFSKSVSPAAVSRLLSSSANLHALQAF